MSCWKSYVAIEVLVKVYAIPFNPISVICGSLLIDKFASMCFFCSRLMLLGVHLEHFWCASWKSRSSEVLIKDVYYSMCYYRQAHFLKYEDFHLRKWIFSNRIDLMKWLSKGLHAFNTYSCFSELGPEITHAGLRRIHQPTISGQRPE